MNPTLQGYSTAVFEAVGPERLAGLADELAAIERLVISAPALRAALTDTAVPASARQGVLRDILEGKVSEPARQLAAFAVAAVHAPDTVTALNWVALRALRLSEGIIEPEPPLSLMRARRARRGLRPGRLRVHVHG